MHDWSQLLRDRIGPLELPPERAEEIYGELADHLEDVYAASIRRGRSDAEALDDVHAAADGWTTLAPASRRAEGGETVRDRLQTLWIPGLTSLAGAAMVILLTMRIFPPSLWADPRYAVHVFIAGAQLSTYVGFGALSASWSRRAGGDRRERLMAALLPLALHVAVVIPAIALGMASDWTRHPEQMRLNFQWGVILALIVAPGVALGLGAVPFLAAAPRSVRR